MHLNPRRIFRKLFIITFVMLCCIAVNRSLAQNIRTSDELIYMLGKYHCKPRVINDSLKDDIFLNFISLADPIKLLFYAGDVEQLKAKHRAAFTLQKDQERAFLEAFAALLNERLPAAKGRLEEATAQAVNLAIPDTLHECDEPGCSYPADQQQMTKRWYIVVKAAILNRIFDQYSVVDTLSKINQAGQSAIEARSRQEIKKKYERWLGHLQGSAEELYTYIHGLYLKSIAACYDPHSTYFSPVEMKEFMTQVTDQGYYFGFYLEEDEFGHILIAEISPGSPAWKCNSLNVGDMLYTIQWEGQDPVDLEYTNIDEVTSILNYSIDKTLKITVKKADGSLRTVSLRKARESSGENVVKGYILSGDIKVGYIYLPAFYTSEEGGNASGSAADVAREIMKLSREGIEGLIIDLRYNGGGSIREAVNLAGIFIDLGPVCITKSRAQKAVIWKDLNPGMAYTGPLIVMVNAYSASASEVVAAALQDHQRALIVGTTTFGKSTGQVLLPFDTAASSEILNPRKNKSEGEFVKITTMQVYRINGNSHQQTGVFPDIELREIEGKSEFAERDYPFVIQNNSIDKKAIYTALPPLPVDTLKKLSLQRLQTDSAYCMIGRLNRLLDEEASKEPEIISWEQRYTQMQKIENLETACNETFAEETQPYQVLNNLYDQELLISDEIFRKLNAHVLVQLGEDAGLRESYHIMKDFISLIKK
jgi:carboxyl-terminal processing protease